MLKRGEGDFSTPLNGQQFLFNPLLCTLYPLLSPVPFPNKLTFYFSNAFILYMVSLRSWGDLHTECNAFRHFVIYCGLIDISIARFISRLSLTRYGRYNLESSGRFVDLESSLLLSGWKRFLFEPNYSTNEVVGFEYMTLLTKTFEIAYGVRQKDRHIFEIVYELFFNIKSNL